MSSSLRHHGSPAGQRGPLVSNALPNLFVVVGSLTVRVLEISEAGDLTRNLADQCSSTASSSSEKKGLREETSSMKAGSKKDGIMDRLRARMSSKQDNSRKKGTDQSIDGGCGDDSSGLDKQSDANSSSSSSRGLHTYANLSIINPTMQSQSPARAARSTKNTNTDTKKTTRGTDTMATGATGKNEVDMNIRHQPGLVVGPSYTTPPTHLWGGAASTSTEPIFVFDHVLSECLLFVGLYVQVAEDACLGTGPEEGEGDGGRERDKDRPVPYFAGYARIPLSRLEENVANCQWYSVSSAESNSPEQDRGEGLASLRTSVRLELLYKRTHDIPSSPPAPGPHISQDHRDIARVEQSHMTITSPLPLAPTANKAQDGLHLQADARVYDCDYFERKHSLAHTSSPLSLSLSQSRSPFSNSDGLGLSNSPGRVSDPKSPLRSGARKKNKSESEMREEGSSPPSAVLCSDADAASDLPGGYAGRDSAAADEGRDGEEEEEEEEEDDDGLFEGLGVAPGEGEGEYAALGEDYYSDSSSSHHCSSDEEEDEQAPAVEADTREVEPQTEAQMHLPVGIVDYVLMFAPPQSQPTGNINGDNSVDGVGTGDQTERDIERVNRGTPGSAHSSGKRGSGMFPSSHNATNNAHNAVGSTYSPANINENAYAYTSSAFEGGVLEGLSPVRLQSRFPHHDHADSPVPDSVEWFAAPRGCVYRTSQKRSQRPPPSTACFVLSSGGSASGGEICGVTLTFFIPCAKDDVPPSVAARARAALADEMCENSEPVRERTGGEMWLPTSNTLAWDGREEAEGACSDRRSPRSKNYKDNKDRVRRRKPLFVWKGVHLCLISRFPLFDPLVRLLEAMYARHFCYASSARPVLSEPYLLGCEALAILFCLEVPVPIPSTFSVTVQLPLLEVCKSENVSSAISEAGAGAGAGYLGTANREGGRLGGTDGDAEGSQRGLAAREESTDSDGDSSDSGDSDTIEPFSTSNDNDNEKVVRVVRRKVPPRDAPITGAKQAKAAATAKVRKKSVLGSWLAGGNSSNNSNREKDKDVHKSSRGVSDGSVDVDVNSTTDATDATNASKHVEGETEDEEDEIQDSSYPSQIDPAPELFFSQPSPIDLPKCPFSISAVARQLSPRVLVDVLAAAFCESKIIFIAQDMAVLPAVCEAVRTLLYPLQWSHVYVPVVPATLLDLVEAPVPFILGIQRDWIRLVSSDCLRDVVIVDVDLRTVDYGHSSRRAPVATAMSHNNNQNQNNRNSLSHPLRGSLHGSGWGSGKATPRGSLGHSAHAGSSIHALYSPGQTTGGGNLGLGSGGGTASTSTSTSTTPKFPDDVSRWLLTGLKALLAEGQGSSSGVSVQRARPGSVQDASIQALVLDTFLSTFLYRVSGCLFFLHPTQPVFNRALLLAQMADQNKEAVARERAERTCAKSDNDDKDNREDKYDKGSALNSGSSSSDNVGNVGASQNLAAHLSFMRTLSDTNGFHAFTDGILAPQLEFFRAAAHRGGERLTWMKQEYGNIVKEKRTGRTSTPYPQWVHNEQHFLVGQLARHGSTNASKSHTLGSHCVDSDGVGDRCEVLSHENVLKARLELYIPFVGWLGEGNSRNSTKSIHSKGSQESATTEREGRRDLYLALQSLPNGSLVLPTQTTNMPPTGPSLQSLQSLHSTSSSSVEYFMQESESAESSRQALTQAQVSIDTDSAMATLTLEEQGGHNHNHNHNHNSNRGANEGFEANWEPSWDNAVAGLDVGTIAPTEQGFDAFSTPSNSNRDRDRAGNVQDATTDNTGNTVETLALVTAESEVNTAAAQMEEVRDHSVRRYLYCTSDPDPEGQMWDRGPLTSRLVEVQLPMPVPLLLDEDTAGGGVEALYTTGDPASSTRRKNQEEKTSALAPAGEGMLTEEKDRHSPLTSRVPSVPSPPPLSPAAVGLPKLDMGSTITGDASVVEREGYERRRRSEKGCEFDRVELAALMAYRGGQLYAVPLTGYKGVSSVCAPPWEEYTFLELYRQNMGLPLPSSPVPGTLSRDQDSDEDSYGSFTDGSMVKVSSNINISKEQEFIFQQAQDAAVSTTSVIVSVLQATGADVHALFSTSPPDSSSFSAQLSQAQGPQGAFGAQGRSLSNSSNSSSATATGGTAAAAAATFSLNAMNVHNYDTYDSSSYDAPRHVFSFLSSAMSSDGYAAPARAFGMQGPGSGPGGHTSDNPSVGLSKADVLLERCLVALRSHENRRLMLQLLRDAKGGGGVQGALQGFGTIFGTTGNTYPLNYAAFEALTICFLEILQHCIDCNDYSMAYDLLEVGGLYYLVGEEGGNANRDRRHSTTTQANNITFLSTQIRHHPLYQSPLLWGSVLRDRVGKADAKWQQESEAVDEGSSQPGSPARTSRKRIQTGSDEGFTGSDLEEEKEKDKGEREIVREGEGGGGEYKKELFEESVQVFQREVLSECRSSLALMHGMGVNFERCVAFLQQVAADYCLDIEVYYELAAYARRVYRHANNNTSYSNNLNNTHNSHGLVSTLVDPPAQGLHPLNTPKNNSGKHTTPRVSDDHPPSRIRRDSAGSMGSPRSSIGGASYLSDAEGGDEASSELRDELSAYYSLSLSGFFGLGTSGSSGSPSAGAGAGGGTNSSSNANSVPLSPAGSASRHSNTSSPSFPAITNANTNANANSSSNNRPTSLGHSPLHAEEMMILAEDVRDGLQAAYDLGPAYEETAASTINTDTNTNTTATAATAGAGNGNSNGNDYGGNMYSDVMGFDILDTRHLQQRRASLISYDQLRMSQLTQAQRLDLDVDVGIHVDIDVDVDTDMDIGHVTVGADSEDSEEDLEERRRQEDYDRL